MQAEVIEELARELGHAPVPAVRASLVRYAELVEQWGARVDLTSAHGEVELAEVLFADAFVLADRELVPEHARVVDVGAGAGAPSVPLLLMRPDLEVTLIEPRRKRVAMLRTALGTLAAHTPRSRVLETRIDPRRPQVPDMPFDLALSRATFPPPQWLRMGLALGACTAVLTAADAPPDPAPGVVIARQRAYEVPRTGAPRTITVYTPQTRPR